MPKRVDANQHEIVEALRCIPGVSVTCTHMVGHGFPDIIVGFLGYNYLLEIKTEKGKLTDSEIKWQNGWAGRCSIVHTVEEAFMAIGLVHIDERF